MGFPVKKSPVNQNTLVKIDETPKVDTTKIIYAQEIPMETSEPRYDDIKNKKITIEPSEQEKIERHKQNMKKMIGGIFDYKELPGGEHEFYYNLPFKNEPIIKYTLKDGEHYVLPKGVIIHLKDSGFILVNEYALDPENPLKKSIRVGKKILRYDFHVDSSDPDLNTLEESRILQISR